MNGPVALLQKIQFHLCRALTPQLTLVEWVHFWMMDVSVRAQKLWCSTFLLFLVTVYRSASSPPTRSCIWLILPSNIPVRYYICKQASETDSLFVGRIISTAWGQAQHWESGICVICCEDQICLTYFSFCTKYLGLAGTPAWQLQFVVHPNFSGDKLLKGQHVREKSSLGRWFDMLLSVLNETHNIKKAMLC